MNEPSSVKIYLLVLLSLLSACSADTNKIYNYVDWTELRFFAEFEVVILSDDKYSILDGVVSQFFVEGYPVELKSFYVKNGFIRTKKYGDVKVITPAALGEKEYGYAITAQQKKMFYELTGQYDNDDLTEVRPNLGRIKEKLEQFPLFSLKIQGEMKNQQSRYVIIKDPGGKFHRVGVGNYIGVNNGRITKITEKSITVMELAIRSNGFWIQREVELDIPQQVEPDFHRYRYKK